MATTEVIFNEFKLAMSNYRFNTKKNRDKYFNKLILKNVYHYKDVYEAYLYEKLNVYFSWLTLLKILALVLASVAVLMYVTQLTIPSYVTLGISAVLIFSTAMFCTFINSFYRSMNFILTILDDEENLKELIKIAEDFDKEN